MKRVFSIVVLGLSLEGCATLAQIDSREEYQSTTNRIYVGFTQDQVIKAAEIVLKHADPDDTTLSYTPDGFLSERKWFVYAVLAAASGIDYWAFETAPTANGVSATALASQDNNTTSIDPYLNGHNKLKFGTVSGGVRGKPITFPIPYRIFWARVDYMLGKREDWVYCKTALKQFGLENGKGGKVYALDGMCDSITMKDAPPPPPLFPYGTSPVIPQQAIVTTSTAAPKPVQSLRSTKTQPAAL